MKKIFYTVALVVMGITASYAQKVGKEKLTAEQRAERAATALQQKLTLTSEQKQKVKEIELDRIQKSDAWRNEDIKTVKSKMEERKVFAQSHKAQLDAVLTADQKKTLDASRKEMKGKMKDRRGAKGLRDRREHKKSTDDNPSKSPVNK